MLRSILFSYCKLVHIAKMQKSMKQSARGVKMAQIFFCSKSFKSTRITITNYEFCHTDLPSTISHYVLNLPKLRKMTKIWVSYPEGHYFLNICSFALMFSQMMYKQLKFQNILNKLHSCGATLKKMSITDLLNFAIYLAIFGSFLVVLKMTF